MKNKLMGLLALASCVVLSGCGGNKDVSIKIADFPTDLVAGSKIDLKDYVTVSGGTGNYSINFDDESFAKITKESETEITLNQYGTVKFTVDYSGKSVEGTINVGSLLLANYVKAAKDVGYNYATMTFDEYGYLQSWANYGEKYIAEYTFSDDGQYYIPGGYVEAPDGNTYSFVYSDADDETGEYTDLEFSVTGSEPDISVYSLPFSLPTSGFEVYSEIDETSGESYEYLVYPENDKGEVADIFENFIGLDMKLVAEYGYTPSSIWIIADGLTGFTEDPDEILVCYDVIAMAKNKEGTEEYLYDMDVCFDDGAFFDDLIKDYVKSGETPKSNYSFNKAAVATAIDTHNFTIDYSADWYNCAVSSDGSELIRKDAIGANPFVTAETDGTLIHDYFNAIGSFKAYVTQNQTFVDVPVEAKYGMINNTVVDELGYKYSYTTIDDVPGYYATSSGKTSFDMWHAANEGKYVNFSFLAGRDFSGDGGVYDSFFINSVEKKGNDTTYYLSGLTAEELFTDLFARAVSYSTYPSFKEEDAYKLFNTFDNVAKFCVDEDMTRYFDTTITLTIVEGVMTGMKFEFVWTDADDPYEPTAYYEYVMSATISFGSTTIPSGVDVTFVA